MELSFETIKFFANPEGIKGLLLKYYSFKIPNEKLEEIGPYRVEEGKLIFDAHEKKDNERSTYSLTH